VTRPTSEARAHIVGPSSKEGRGYPPFSSGARWAYGQGFEGQGGGFPPPDWGTSVVSVSELLAGLGSGSAAETSAVLLRVPLEVGLTVMVTVAPAPLATEPSPARSSVERAGSSASQERDVLPEPLAPNLERVAPGRPD
jgi:hypothetical protein